MAADKERARIRINKATALRCRSQEDEAPKAAAKGKGRIADKILGLAQEYGAPIKEDPDLVEVLAQIELDQEIPPEVYLAVAEILSFIYRSDDRWRERVNGLAGPGLPG